MTSALLQIRKIVKFVFPYGGGADAGGCSED